MQITDKEFDNMVQQLQQKSFDEVRETFGEEGFKRWRNPRFNGPLPDADCSACLRGSCGDTIEIYLKFQNNRVAEASYVTNGCGSSALCGSFTAELAHGRKPAEIMELRSSDILAAIGKFPRKDEHCATLSILTLHKALNNYMVGLARKTSSE